MFQLEQPTLPPLGKIYGRFFLKPHLGLEDGPEEDLCTISEVIETFPHWGAWAKQVPQSRVQLFTMFETSDVHPDILREFRHFEKVLVPCGYLRDILVRHGVNCVSLDWYTSPLIRQKPGVKPKDYTPDRLVFLYVGTNDVRKNTVNLVNTFQPILEGSNHVLILKTNHAEGLPLGPNIHAITANLNIGQMADLYNSCDYVVSFTRGEGVGLPMLEAHHFGKPVISPRHGAMADIPVSNWIDLPFKETKIHLEGVPEFLEKVFYQSWWEVDYPEATRILRSLITDGRK